MRTNERTPTTPRVASRIGRATVLAAATVGLTVFLAGTASAAPITQAELTIDQRQCFSSEKEVRVYGVAAMWEKDAQRFIDRPGHEVEMTVWGDDPSYDDRIHGPVNPTHYYTTSRGLHFFFFGCVSNSALNEDWGQDEVYVKITLSDFRDGSVTNANTNQVSRSF